MTITSQLIRQDFAGEGLDSFEVAFAFQRTDDLRIERKDAYGEFSALAEGADYSVTLYADSPGGYVSLVTPLGMGESLVIRRDPPMVQETEYVENDSFPAKSHEAALDRLTMISQALSDRVDRCLSSDENAPLADHALPAPEAGKGLMWSEETDSLVNSSVPLADLARAVAIDSGDPMPGTLTEKLDAGPGLVALIQASTGEQGSGMVLAAPTLVTGEDPGHTHSGGSAPGDGTVIVGAGDSPGALQDKLAPLTGMSMSVGTGASGQVLNLGPKLKGGGGLRSDSAGLYVELSDIGEDLGAHTHEWDDLQAVPSRYEGDLNMLTDSGPYYVTSIASNLPGTVGGFLLVVRDSPSEIGTDAYSVLQQFTEATVGGRTYQRQLSGGGWQAWLQVNTSEDSELPAEHRLNRMLYYAVQIRLQMVDGELQHSFLGHVGSGNPLEYASVILEPSMTVVGTPLLDETTGFVGGAGVLASDNRKLVLDTPNIDGIPVYGRPSLVGRLTLRQSTFVPGGMPPCPFVAYSINENVAGDTRTRLSVELRDATGASVNWTAMTEGSQMILYLDGYTTPEITA